MAAEVGHLGLAYQYLHEAALMDLEDLEKNTRDGLHMASLAGTWMALVAGFGGMRPRGDSLGFAPRLPEAISRLAFRLEVRGRPLRIEIEHSRVTLPPLRAAAVGRRAPPAGGPDAAPRGGPGPKAPVTAQKNRRL